MRVVPSRPVRPLLVPNPQSADPPRPAAQCSLPTACHAPRPSRSFPAGGQDPGAAFSNRQADPAAAPQISPPGRLFHWSKIVHLVPAPCKIAVCRLGHARVLSAHSLELSSGVPGQFSKGHTEVASRSAHQMSPHHCYYIT